MALPIPDPIAIAGAASVFSFITGTAEQVAAGYRWQTYDYGNQPQYHFCIFNGVGGIPIFLTAYYQATGDERALDLARGALAWSFQAAPPPPIHQRGLQFGRLGLAHSALLLSAASGQDEFSAEVEAITSNLLQQPCGPITDLVGGESSNGWYLLQQWQHTKEERLLEGAMRCGEWLADQMIRDELGTHCLVDPIGNAFGPQPYTGLSHGISGVAYFLACLYAATHDVRWKDLANELLRTLQLHALPDDGGLNWSVRLGGKDLTRCQYSHGSAGIGLVFALAAKLLDEPDHLRTALLAGETTYQRGDFRKNPTLCTGLAGGGELLVELYRITRDDTWLTRAREFAQLAAGYRVIRDGHDYWPTDGGTDCFSADFTYGAAGTGYFFLRATDPMKHAAPLM